MEKICIGCKDPKPLTEFGVDSRCKDGRKSRCLLCTSKYHRDHRKTNLGTYKRRAKKWRDSSGEHRREVARNYRKKMRLEAFRRYGAVCACCSESQYEFLGIDHVNGGGRKHRKKIGSGLGIYSWLRQQGYPPGFQVLCHNCNMAKGLYGKCPHELIQRPQ